MTYQYYRHGSARWATLDDAHRAGLIGQSLLSGQGMYGGEFYGHPIYARKRAPINRFGKSQSGKLASLLGYTAILHPGRNIFSDPRGDLCAFSMDYQAHSGKGAYSINPLGLHDLPKHTINPTQYMRSGTISLTADIKTAMASLVTSTGTDDDFFMLTARRIAEGHAKYDALEHGSVSLLRMYETINTMQLKKSEKWRQLAKRMSAAAPEIKAVIAEVLSMQSSDSRAYDAAMAELNNAFGFMSDPAIRDLFSNTPDFDMEDFIKSGERANVYFIIPVELMQVWAPLLRMFYSGLTIVKGRYPQAPQINLIIDEAGQLGHAEFITRGITYGAGMGVLLDCVWQDAGQIENLYGPEGLFTLIGSSYMLQFIGIGEAKTGALASEMLGKMTLGYWDDQRVGEEQHAARQAFLSGIFGGAGIMHSIREARHHDKMARTPDYMERPLQAPDELMRMGVNDNIVLTPGSGCPPLWASRMNYWERPELAGRFFENPYHNPPGEITVSTGWRQRRARIIETRPPAHLAHLPQFKAGRPFRYVEGFRPF